jgi:hypothetical protein
VFCLLLPLHFRCFITNLFSTGNNGYISSKSLYILSGPDKTTIYFFNSGCRLIYARFIFLEPESCLFTINYVIELSYTLRDLCYWDSRHSCVFLICLNLSF